MNQQADVLERTVVHPGKYFIKAGENNMRAYIIQSGEIASYNDNGEGQKVEIERYGPGSIIGEKGLLFDDVPELHFEALQSSTLIIITRQDFEKQLKKSPKVVRTVLDHTMKKIQDYEDKNTKKTMGKLEVDDIAAQLVKSLVQGLSEEKKSAYSVAIMPHINGLIKSLKQLKSS